jgi:predicted flap endonuclease-1-like 5' DNA nuclease
MLDIALQIVLNLFIAFIIGLFLGIIIGKSSSKSKKDEKKEQKPQKDNLKKIKGIDSKIEFELKRLGIDSFKQIASWTQKDISTIGASLNIEELINELQWVDQAKILASGEETLFSQTIR